MVLPGTAVYPLVPVHQECPRAHFSAPKPPVFDATRANNWYTAGFLLGAGSVLRENRGGGKRKAAGTEQHGSAPIEQKKAS
jgi:hypothetical protein